MAVRAQLDISSDCFVALVYSCAAIETCVTVVGLLPGSCSAGIWQF